MKNCTSYEKLLKMLFRHDKWKCPSRFEAAKKLGIKRDPAEDDPAFESIRENQKKEGAGTRFILDDLILRAPLDLRIVVDKGPAADLKVNKGQYRIFDNFFSILFCFSSRNFKMRFFC